MEKTFLSLIIISAISVSVFGGSTKKQIDKPTTENSVLMNLTEAKTLTLGALEKNYANNKTTCEKALNFANLKIKEGAESGKPSVLLSYVSGLRDDGLSIVDFYTMCPINIIRYEIAKQGFVVKTDEGKSDNHFYVLWY